MRTGKCRVCGRTFEAAGSGPLPLSCPEHRADHQQELARRRMERWVVKKAGEIMRRALED